MRHLYLFLILFAMVSAVYAQEHPAICKDHMLIVAQEQHQHQQRATFRSNPLTQDYDLKYHRLEWEIDPAVHYIRGRVTSYFIPSVSGFQQINMDLHAEMQVNAIRYRGNLITNFSLTSDHNLQINLANVIPNGQLDSITVEYEGAPVSDGFGSYETTTHNSIPVMWTLSQPYGAKDWWPCKQDLFDKIDSVDILVTTPSDYRVATNGTLVSEALQGTNTLYHWRHHYPIPAYLIAIAITNYDVFSDFVELDNGDSLEILNYVFPEDIAAAGNLSQTVAMMEFFNDLFGTYPFAQEKYGHAQFGWSGGMEHQTMSFMGGFSFELQAHELAHQWFGNKVTCGSWTDIWLNEGFATYLTGLTFETVLAGSIWWDEWKRVVIANASSVPDGSVFVTDTTSVERLFQRQLSYSKGALLLHMLRWKLGDDDFFQSLRNYLNDPALSFGYARTKDLQRHFELQSGEDLEVYFQQWFYGEGFPSYQVLGEPTDTGIELTLNQTTSHPSVPFYIMPVPVQLKGEGRDTIVRLDHTFSGQQFSIDLPFVVDSIFFDPDRWLFSANNTVELSSTTSTVAINPLKDQVDFHPNPFTDELHLEVKGTIAIDQIQIYNAQGQLITPDLKVLPGENRLITKNWPVGVYWLNIQSGDKTITHKLIKGL